MNINLSLVSLEEYSSLITRGSFPYSSKYQEVPIAYHPPVQNIQLTSGSCTVPATLQVKLCIKQLQQITRKKCKVAMAKIQVKRILKVRVRTTEQTAIESASFFKQTF